jgi:hypothetical protein
MEVKQALRDRRFRDNLPSEFQEDVQKYLQNPGCACNVPFYKKVITNAKQQLQEYYPNRTVADFEDDAQKLSQNKFSVINCHIDNLEEKLKRLPTGRKQIAIARYEDEVTVIVNELDFLY